MQKLNMVKDISLHASKESAVSRLLNYLIPDGVNWEETLNLLHHVISRSMEMVHCQ